MPTYQSDSVDRRNNLINSGFKLCAFLIALLPFVLHLRGFRRLVWFGDEYDLLNQIHTIGLVKWAWSPFAENFIPLFKLLWGMIVIGVSGSYIAMITLLWITHAFNTALIYHLLQKLKCSPLTALFASSLFGLSWSIYESLGWSVQWSALLCTTFFLLGLCFVFSSASDYEKRGLTSTVWLVPLFAACSVFSFSRGFAVCGVLGLAMLLVTLLIDNRPNLKLVTISGLCFLPAITAGLVLFKFASGNHHELLGGDTSKFVSMREFAVAAFSLNPLQHLINISDPSPVEILILCVIKAGILIGAVFAARGNKSHLIFVTTLVFFDLANSVLLGIGRHHTGVHFATSSRYQYEFLLVFSLLAGYLASKILNERPLLILLQLGAGLFLIWHINKPADDTWREWFGWRGRDGRKALRALNEGHPQTGNERWIGFPVFLSDQQIVEVVKEYNLH